MAVSAIHGAVSGDESTTMLEPSVINVNVTAGEDVFQKNVNMLTVNDVYNIAASIGKDFEKLTDTIGGEAFADVMPKIVTVLEMLESFSGSAKNYSSDAVELNATIQKLELEAKFSSDKYREELEKVESAWKEDVKQLKTRIETMQEDNKRLAILLAENANIYEDIAISTESKDTSVTDTEESLENYKSELREKSRIIEQQTAECEAVLQKCDPYNILPLQFSNANSALIASRTGNKTECKLTKKDYVDGEASNSYGKPEYGLGINLSRKRPPNQGVAQKVSSPLPDPLLANKLVIDLNDPDRPRYTMQELQEVLSERNSFKLKCILLEDELDYYKQFLKETRNDESWVELEELTLVPTEEVNNNNDPNLEEDEKSTGVIKKLFASIFPRRPTTPESNREPERHPAPCILKYNRPFIDESDVMPAIDLQPSPEDESPTVENNNTFNFGKLHFSTDSSSDSKN